jgi:hypothetical protein
MSAPSVRFTRERRDDLVRHRHELRYGEGYYNYRRNAYHERRPLCDDGDICTHCEYALHETLWPPTKSDDNDNYQSGCLGWIDCIMATTACSFCVFLAKLFFDASPGFPRDQVVCKTNRRRFCIWLYWGGCEGVTASQPRQDQWSGYFHASVQEVGDFDLEIGSFTPYRAQDSEGLRFRLDVGSRIDFIALFGPPQSEEAAVLNLSRPIGQQWNSSLFRDALQACKTHHGESCDGPVSGFQSTQRVSQTPAEIGKQLRVVDVIAMCVSTLPKDQAYVALSYCWSKKRYSVLTLGNREEVSKPGGLNSLDLPPTISDATIAMRAIDERYIWIDSLCIVQDDHENKAAELARMDDIYRAASLTIIAAATPLDSTEVGLPGVREGSARRNAAVLDIRGLKFRQCYPGLWNGLAGSKWHSRAWTFQEYLLSKRYLIFMPEQVYFVCHKASFAENYIDHICAKQMVVKEQSLVPCCDITILDNEADGKDSHRPLHFINSYVDLVTSYTRREMSYEVDAINAARGLLHLLRREHGIAFLCGLPIPHLVGYFLTWAPVGSSVRRKPSIAGGDQFPSWTWAGWQGEAAYPSTAFPDDLYDDGFDVKGVHVDLEDEVGISEAIHKANAKAEHTSISLNEPHFSSPDLASIDHCYLKFTAEVACFSVSTSTYGALADDFKPSDTEHSTCHQIIAQGVQVGSVIMHQFNRTAAPHFDAEKPRRPTFMALSRAKARWRMWLPIDERHPSDDSNFWYEKDDGTFVDHPPFDEDVYDVRGSIVNVLLICTSNAGITYRAGVGQIHADAWEVAEPEQKQIILG